MLIRSRPLEACFTAATGLGAAAQARGLSETRGWRALASTLRATQAWENLAQVVAQFQQKSFWESSGTKVMD